MGKVTIPLEVVNALVSYNPSTGRFTWKVSRRGGTKKGTEALRSLGENGYLYGTIAGKVVYAHRVALAISQGFWPEHEVDHINMNRLDNRIENLRNANRTQNSHNRDSMKGSSSKYKGVSWDALLGKWRAQIRINGSNRYIGVYPSEQEAHRAYVSYATTTHGDFLRVGE